LELKALISFNFMRDTFHLSECLSLVISFVINAPSFILLLLVIHGESQAEILDTNIIAKNWKTAASLARYSTLLV